MKPKNKIIHSDINFKEDSTSLSEKLPPFYELLNNGLYENVKIKYASYKERHILNNPKLNNTPDDLMASYISYYCMYLAIKNNEKNKNTNKQGKDTLVVINLDESLIDSFIYQLFSLNISEEFLKLRYDSYVYVLSLAFYKDKTFTEIIKKSDNPNFDKAVKSYFINGNKFSVEKIGLNITDEEVMELCKYLTYLNLYNGYYEEKQNKDKNKKNKTPNIISDYIVVKRFKKVGLEEAKAHVNNTLSNIESKLYSFEEFKTHHQMICDDIKEIVAHADKEYFDYVRLTDMVRKHIRKDENNENI